MKIVYSKHAEERIKLRHLSHHDLELTILNPDHVVHLENKQTKYIKNLKNRKYHVIVKDLPEQQKRLIISAWIRGEDDPESLLITIIMTPFRILWDIIVYLWQKATSHRPQSNPKHRSKH